MKTRDRIISIMKITVLNLKRTHNFGIDLPKMVNEAVAINAKNRNTL